MTTTGARPEASRPEDPIEARLQAFVERRSLEDGRRGILLDLVGFGLFAGTALWLVVAGAASSGDAGPAAALVAMAGAAVLVGRLAASASRILVPAAVAGLALALAFSAGEDLVGGGPLAPPFGYANATGAFCAQAALAGLMLAVATRRPGPQIAGTIAALGFASVSVGTSVAAAILVVALGVIALAAWLLGAPRGAVALMGGAFLAAVIVTAAVGATYSPDDPGRLGAIAQDSVGERRALLWRDAVDIMREHPVIGAGPGSFRELSPTALDDRDAVWAHHGFLQVGAETGVPGFLLLVALFVWGFARLWAGPPDAITALGAASLAALGIHASIDYVMHFPAIPLAAAVLVGAATAARRRRA